MTDEERLEERDNERWFSTLGTGLIAGRCNCVPRLPHFRFVSENLTLLRKVVALPKATGTRSATAQSILSRASPCPGPQLGAAELALVPVVPVRVSFFHLISPRFHLSSEHEFVHGIP